MITWLLLNTLISLLAFCVLPALTQAPPRFRLRLCGIALVLWFVPLQYLALPGQREAGRLFLVPLGEAVQDGVTTPLVELGLAPSWFFWFIIFTGAVILAITFWQHFRALKRWRLQAQPADHLRGLIPDSKKLKFVTFYSLPNLAGAMTTGWFRPVIWIGHSHLKSDTLRTLLVHEWVHVLNRDNFWRLGLTVMRALFWWHPLVHLLASRAAFFLETSCDQQASSYFPPREYRSQLAAALYRSQVAPLPPTDLASTAFINKKTNLKRLKCLERRMTMKSKHLLALLLFLLGSTLLVAFQPADKKQPKSTVSKYKGFVIEEINVKDKPVVEVLQFIAEKVGINIFIDQSVGDIRCTYQLKNIPWDQALDIILANANLAYTHNDGYLRIASPKQMQSWAVEKNKLDHAMLMAEETELLTFNLNNAPARNVADILATFLSPRGQIQYDARTNTVVVEDVKSRSAKLTDLIKKLDRKMKQ